jgi:hypothetical protein
MGAWICRCAGAQARGRASSRARGRVLQGTHPQPQLARRLLAPGRGAALARPREVDGSEGQQGAPVGTSSRRRVPLLAKSASPRRALLLSSSVLSPRARLTRNFRVPPLIFNKWGLHVARRQGWRERQLTRQSAYRSQPLQPVRVIVTRRRDENLEKVSHIQGGATPTGASRTILITTWTRDPKLAPAHRLCRSGRKVRCWPAFWLPNRVIHRVDAAL